MSKIWKSILEKWLGEYENGTLLENHCILTQAVKRLPYLEIKGSWVQAPTVQNI